MYKLILVFGICSVFALSNSKPVSNKTSGKIVGCYYHSVVRVEGKVDAFGISQIDASVCTHVIFMFNGSLTVAKNGSIEISGSMQKSPPSGTEALKTLRKSNSLIKILASFERGFSYVSNHSEILNNKTLRGKFVEGLVNFVNKKGFSGIGLRWEALVQRRAIPDDKKNIVLLLKELREKLNQHGFTLFFSAEATEEVAETAYDIKEISKYVDFINLITSFHRSPGLKTVAHRAPMHPSSKESADDKKLNVDSAVKYWIDHGASPGKLVLRIGLAGAAYTLKDPKKFLVGSPLTEPQNSTALRSISRYDKICYLLKHEKWQLVYDKEQHVPYAHKGNQIVAFENVDSIKEKAAYIKRMGLLGATMVTIAHDDFSGKCGDKYPLLKTMSTNLRK